MTSTWGSWRSLDYKKNFTGLHLHLLFSISQIIILLFDNLSCAPINQFPLSWGWVHKVIKNKDYNLGPVVRHLQVKEFDIPYQLGDVTAGGLTYRSYENTTSKR